MTTQVPEVLAGVTADEPAAPAKPARKPTSRATRSAKPKQGAKAVAVRSKGTVAKEQPAAKAQPKRGPKTDGRKNDLALQVVTAALSIPGLSKDEKQMVANWVHHLPTGGGTGPNRRWPKGAPRPQRSDWA